MNCELFSIFAANFINSNILKTIIHIILLFLFSLNITAQTPKHEIRAVWLTTIKGLDWPHSHSVYRQKQELTDILDQLQKANINTILIQTRVRASTIFPSTMEPWDICMTGNAGQSPGYDALQFCIEECHKRGMECHAWIVTIPVGKWNSDGCKKIKARFPNLIKKVGDEGYMDPEMSQTGDYLAQFCREVTRRYDIDGIHLDYIRYPETWKMKVSREQGRRYITDIVRKIHRAVKGEKPWVKMSCSPVGKFDDLARYRSGGWNAYTAVCQDAQGWLREGIMDVLFPMMYFQGNNFYPFVSDWKEHAYGRQLAPGLAIYMLHPQEKNWDLNVIKREMNVLRSEELGITFFRSKFLTDNIKGIYSFTKDFNQYPALVPPMSWTGKQAPSPVRTLNIQRGMKADILSWQGARNNSGVSYLLYNVYASKSYPVDTKDARNLIATHQRESSLTVPHKGHALYYAVTAMDRFGNESAPKESPNTILKDRKPIDFRQLIIGNSDKKYKKKRK
jgi:uncharacterized lipoprotein YddW (UPF0748 family)